MKQDISLLTLVGPGGRRIKTSTRRLRGSKPSAAEWRRLAAYHPEISRGGWTVVERQDV